MPTRTTTSLQRHYERPTAPWCELVTPHEYMGMPAKDVDAYLCTQLLRFKSFGKPVQYTEFGNQGILTQRRPGQVADRHVDGLHERVPHPVLGNVGREDQGRRRPRATPTPTSARKTASTSASCRSSARDLPLDLRPVASGYTDQLQLRTYALGNGQTAVLYVHHFATTRRPTTLTDEFFVATGPGKFKLRWIDPATGETVQEDDVATSGLFSTIKIPPVKIDLACRFDRQEQPAGTTE